MPKVRVMSQVIENPSAAENVAAKPSDQSASGTRVFPLPLTPFERYMVEDDRDECPMTFAIVVELSGEVDQNAMEAAVISALKRHPLARARLKRVGNYDHWVAGSLPAEPVAWHEGPPLRLPFGGKRIDLHTQQGFRVDGYQQQGSCCLVFSVHHALADGLGALQFVGDTLACYGIATSAADPPQLAPLSPGRLKRRGYFDIKLPHPVSRWTAIKSLLSEGWRTLSRRPVVLRPAAERASVSGANAGYVTVTLDEAEVAELRQSSTALEATINQRLVSDLFLTLRKWQTERAQRPAKWLRVTVPTSLRSRADQVMPATNILGYLMLTRHERDCRDEQSLLKGLVAELEFALRWAMGALFAAAVAYVDRFPGLLGFLARRSRRFSTAVLSNLGEVTRRFSARFPRQDGKLLAGNLVLENLTAAPPVRPGTSIAIAVLGCAGKLSLCAQYDPQVLCEQDVQEFLDMYLEFVKRDASNFS